MSTAIGSEHMELISMNIDAMTVKELRDHLGLRMLSRTGRKADLVARLKLSKFSSTYHENPSFATLMGEVDRLLPDYHKWMQNENLMEIFHRLMAGEYLNRWETFYIGSTWHPQVCAAIAEAEAENRKAERSEEEPERTGVSFNDVKGLGPLVEWSAQAGKLFTPEARQYGFSRFPSGVLLTGVPGCGKTMIAKALAQEWGMGFRRVYPDQLVGQLIGDNERFMRELCDELREKAPIVCFIDEAEKILGQTRSPGFYRVSDSARDSAESILLQFMEEDDSGVFFVFTANDFEKLSPALIDRFEERFFIDLPTLEARVDMIGSMLLERGRSPSNFDVEHLAELSKDYTGRDIRSAVDEAMKVAFCDGGREFTTEDLEKAFEQTCPTSVVHKKSITKMRQMVTDGKMRRANASDCKAMDRLSKDGSFVGWN